MGLDDKEQVGRWMDRWESVRQVSGKQWTQKMQRTSDASSGNCERSDRVSPRPATSIYGIQSRVRDSNPVAPSQVTHPPSLSLGGSHCSYDGPIRGAGDVGVSMLDR